MDLSTLKPAEGSTHKRKRIGRGPGSGLGGTSTRGHKGAKSRSGYKKKIGFEGGQMPLQRRLPKFGFKNINRVDYRPINLSSLEAIAEANNLDTITKSTIVAAGLASKNDKIKILSMGELKRPLKVEADAFSKKAKELIEAAGGSAVTA
ncbi:50S ribosomal protein L15 [Porphyromonas miyakawae]|uniref:Large ribosomal subunit protein uL15 n=1 Tax=Porphyromonas miyakawae TaxID=3137470 RepID=A0ABQ0E0R0_9PORP